MQNPGPIANESLVANQSAYGTLQIREDLQLKHDFRVINKQSWSVYQKYYGGGPVIAVEIPRDCADTGKWINAIRLHQVGKVGFNYLDDK